MYSATKLISIASASYSIFSSLIKSMGEVKHSAGRDGVMIKPLGLVRFRLSRLTSTSYSGLGVGIARMRDLRCVKEVFLMTSSCVLAVLRVSQLV